MRWRLPSRNLGTRAVAADVGAGRAGWPRGDRRTPKAECSIGVVDGQPGTLADSPGPITSRRHPLVERCRRASRGADPGTLLLDGEHLLEVALDVGWPVEVVALVSTVPPGSSPARLAARAAAAGVRVVEVSAGVLEAMSPVRTPHALVSLAAHRSPPPDPLAGPVPLVVVACGVQDAGNVGAIVRVADACGATGVVCGGGCADPFGWKALRGSMGSGLRLPVARPPDMQAVFARMGRRGLALVAATGAGGVPPHEVDWTRSTALLVGNEGAGLSDAVLGLAGTRVAIPMRPGVESLNVAVAAGILLYEASRQRGAR